MVSTWDAIAPNHALNSGALHQMIVQDVLYIFTVLTDFLCLLSNGLTEPLPGVISQCLDHPSIHPSNFFCLPEIGSWGQQPKQWTPDFPLPSYFIQLFRKNSQARYSGGILRPAERLQYVLHLPWGLLAVCGTISPGNQMQQDMQWNWNSMVELELDIVVGLAVACVSSGRHRCAVSMWMTKTGIKDTWRLLFCWPRKQKGCGRTEHFIFILPPTNRLILSPAHKSALFINPNSSTR